MPNSTNSSKLHDCVDSTRVRTTVAPLIVIAFIVFGATATLSYRQQLRVVAGSEIAINLTNKGEVRPLAEVVRIVRAMNLVTVEVTTKVSSRIEDERWRGSVSAKVEARVCYHYGVDLSRLEQSSFRRGPLSESVTITVPEPKCISVEVDPTEDIHEVTVSGVRLRSRAGEFMLGLARLAIYGEARKCALSLDQREHIRNESREILRELVRSIVGEDTPIEIVFSDPN